MSSGGVASLPARRQQRDAFAAAAERCLLGILPILSVPIVLVLAHPLHNFAVDFHSWYWPAGKRVLNGLSPYALSPWRALNYPAPAALLFVPFALLPHGAADWVFTALVLGALVGALRMVGVRDWRVYGIVMFWQPVIIGYETANVSLLLLLGLAACWRFRDRAPIVGAVLALMVCVKVFPIVIAIWLLATRRLRACAWMLAAIVALNVVAWTLIGWSQVSVYLHVVSAVRRYDESRGYSLISFALHLGAGRASAYAIGIAAAGAVLVVALRAHGESRDRIVLSGCVAASLLISPLVESHYVVLMIVPLALAQPRLSLIWALPLVLLVTPADFPDIWSHALGLCVFAALCVASMTPRAPETTRAPSVGVERSAGVSVT